MLTIQSIVFNYSLLKLIVIRCLPQQLEATYISSFTVSFLSNAFINIIIKIFSYFFTYMLLAYTFQLKVYVGLQHLKISWTVVHIYSGSVFKGCYGQTQLLLPKQNQMFKNIYLFKYLPTLCKILLEIQRICLLNQFTTNKFLESQQVD